jgi:hypothetical protein
MNAEKPSPSGVISSPDPKHQDSIQPSYRPKPVPAPARKTQSKINDSDDDSDGEVQSHDTDNSKAAREEPGQVFLHNVRGVARVSDYRKAKQ